MCTLPTQDEVEVGVMLTKIELAMSQGEAKENLAKMATDFGTATRDDEGA